MKKRIKTMMAIVLCVVVVIGFFVFDSAAEEIKEENPTLEFVEIDSDAEMVVNKKPIYKQKSEFTQAQGTYNIKTNSYVAWSEADDIAYAYKKYPVSEKKGDFMEATVTLKSIPTSSAGTLHMNASAGLMFRSGLSNDAAEVFLHVRGYDILVVYRSRAGELTYVQYTHKNVVFPVELKMRKELNQVRLSWKSAGQDWQSFRYPVAFTTGGPLYVGLSGHSCDEKAWLMADFSNLNISGYGTYDGTNDEDEPTIEEEYVEEDIPAASNVMLRETFSDGDLMNTPTSATNPIWPEPKDFKILNIDGNRVWDRTFVDQNDWVGEWDEDDWTDDYDVSADVLFTEDCNPDPSSSANAFRLYARHTGIEFYGHTQYTAEIKEGYKISLYKACFISDKASLTGEQLGNTVDLRVLLDDPDYQCLGDNKWHNFKMRVFDNQITVYWDDKEVISYTDNGTSKTNSECRRVFAVGGVGIGTYQTAVYVDNILVERLTDTFGGDYDNQIGGNWNLPIPEYVLEFEEKY